jgi:hypothetical protein
MLLRCYDPNHHNFERYHVENEVAVCDRWRDKENGFSNFLADMGPRPEGMTLDRENPLGNYEPGNCRWATAKEQFENRACMYSEEELAELQRQADEAAAQLEADGVF